VVPFVMKDDFRGIRFPSVALLNQRSSPRVMLSRLTREILLMSVFEPSGTGAVSLMGVELLIRVPLARRNRCGSSPGLTALLREISKASILCV